MSGGISILAAVDALVDGAAIALGSALPADDAADPGAAFASTALCASADGGAGDAARGLLDASCFCGVSAHPSVPAKTSDDAAIATIVRMPALPTTFSRLWSSKRYFHNSDSWLDSIATPS